MNRKLFLLFFILVFLGLMLKANAPIAGGGGGGGGGGGATVTTKTTTTVAPAATTTVPVTTVPLAKEEIIPEKRKISLPVEISGIPTWIIGIVIGVFVAVAVVFVFIRRGRSNVHEKDIREKFTLPEF
jgi:hypothetical protein